MKFSCPKCDGHIDASPEWASQSIDCPHCQASITVPAEVGEFQKSAILEFSRPWALSGCARTFNVYVDGAKVAMLKNGGSQNIPVPPGTHEVAGGMGKKHGCVFSIEAGPADHLPLKVWRGRSGVEIEGEGVTLLRARSHIGGFVIACGAVGVLIGIAGFIGVLCGISELSLMKEGKADSSGKGLVIAGIVLGAFGFLGNTATMILMATQR